MYEDSNQYSTSIKDLSITASPTGERILVQYETDWDFCEGKLHLRVQEVIAWNAKEKAIESTYRVRLLESRDPDPSKWTGIGT